MFPRGVKSVNADQLRAAFSNLNGRDLRIEFEGAETLLVRNAMLIPSEQDDLLKVTDGGTGAGLSLWDH